MSRRAAALSLALALCAIVVVGAAGAEKRGGATSVFSASTGNNSERLKTLPIRKPSREKETVVMSLGPGSLPALEAADKLLATAELQLSTTCAERSRRCIGKPYGYSPKMSAHIVIANGRDRTNGDRISSVDTKQCHQPLPHRNHHCVLVLKDGIKEIGNPANLPCPPDQCFVNVVASAVSSKARSGNVVTVGADTPSGSVRQDKGRIDAVVLRGNGLTAEAGRTDRRVKRRVPIGGSGNKGLRVIYSLPIRDFQRGDAYRIEARSTMKIHHLPYNAFIGAQLIVTSARNDPNPSRRARRMTASSQITEGNGFNCTRGHSAYESPCVTRKIGLLRFTRDAGTGAASKLYVNYVGNASPKRANPRARDDAVARGDGFLEARRYRDPD